MICGMDVHTWRVLPILAQPGEPDRQPGAGGCFSQLKPMHHMYQLLLDVGTRVSSVCSSAERYALLLYCWRCVVFSQRLSAKTKRTTQSRPSSLESYTLLRQLKPELTSGAPALPTGAACDCNRAALVGGNGKKYDEKLEQ